MKPFTPFPLRSRQRGVSLITGIFILLLLATLAALMANVVSSSHTTAAEDVLGSRAYQSARGGVEWGLYQVLDPDNNFASTALSAQAALVGCFAPTAVSGLGATVTVSCASTDWTEGTKSLRVYRITSTATLPGPGFDIERQLEVTADKCRDSAVAAPYDC